MEQAATVERNRFRLVLTMLTAFGLLASIVALAVDRSEPDELVTAAPGDAPGFMQVASLDRFGGFGFGYTAEESTLSGNGRYLAFTTDRSIPAQEWATDSDRGSEADERDVYVRDLQTGEISLISYGFPIDFGEVTFASMSANPSARPMQGRFSFAAPMQTAPPTESECRVPNVSEPIDRCFSANDASSSPSISRDGRFVAFESRATNLRDHDDDDDGDDAEDGNGTTESQDETDWSGDVPVAVFVHDRDFDGNGTFDEAFPGASRTYLASLNDEALFPPTQGPQEFIAATYDPSISGDGSRVAFTLSGDCSPECGPTEIFVRDIPARRTSRLTQPPIEGEVPQLAMDQPEMSADGQHVAYTLYDTGEGETQVAVYDFPRAASSFAALPGFVGDYVNATERPSISADGSVVAFQSIDDELWPGLPSGEGERYQVYVRERDPATGDLGTLQIVSADPVTGEIGTGHSFDPSISASGQYVAFSTGATNLHDDFAPGGDEARCDIPFTDGVFNDLGNYCDVLVLDRFAPAAQALELASRADANSQDPSGANESSHNPTVSADGGVITFETRADNLIPTEEPYDFPGDPNSDIDVYAWRWTPELIAGPQLSFGNVDVGDQSLAQTATFIHQGFGPVQGMAFENPPEVPAGFGPLAALQPVLSPGNAAPNEFELVPGANQCATLGLLHAGQTCGVGVVFRPQATGSRTATVVIFHSGSSEIASVPLLGGGRTGQPTLGTNPTSIDFGEQLIGVPSGPVTVTVRNTASALPVTTTTYPQGSFPGPSTTAVPPPTVSISTIGIGGLHATDFVIVGNACDGRSLLPGESCTVTVVFTPTDDGPRSGFIQINDDAVGGPHLVLLTGGAPKPVVQLNPAIGTPGTVTQVSGSNWPPNAVVTISSPGFIESATATTDGSGKFATDLVIFPRSGLGERGIAVSAGVVVLDPPATFLVVANTMQGGPDFVFRR